MDDETRQAIEAAVTSAVQEAKRLDALQGYATATILEMNASGVGIHDVIIDGDTAGAAVAAHQITCAPLQAGARIAVILVPPHQCWIIGELKFTGAALRVYSTIDTNLVVGNPAVVKFDKISYDYDGVWDLTNFLYVAPDDGLYEFNWRLLTNTVAVGERFGTSLFDFDASVTLSAGSDLVAGQAARLSLHGHDTVLLSAGQRVCVLGSQINGTNRLIDGIGSSDNYFTGRRV